MSKNAKNYHLKTFIRKLINQRKIENFLKGRKKAIFFYEKLIIRRIKREK